MRITDEQVDTDLEELDTHFDASGVTHHVSSLSEDLKEELHQLEGGFVALGGWFSELIQLAKNIGNVSETQFSKLRLALGDEFRINLDSLNSTIGKCQGQIDYGLTSLSTVRQSMTSVCKECSKTVDDLEGLRISVVGLKIESAFSQQCLTVLAGFPEQVSDVVLRISGALQGISENAERVDSGVLQECERLQAVAQSLQELSLNESESESKLIDLIRGLENKVTQCHTLGIDMGRDISQLASKGIFNLQIGDIINQRCHHVLNTLSKMEDTLQDPSNNPEDFSTVREALCLQVRQVDTLREDVVKASQEMEQLYSNLEFVVDSMEEHHSKGFSIGDMFNSVTRELEHMTDRVRLSMEAAKEIDGTASTLGKQIQTMSGYRRELRSINEKLRLVAMNTTIRATRLGKHGIVIKALSDEICDFQKSTEKVIVWMDKTLRSTEKETNQLSVSASQVQSEAEESQVPLMGWIKNLKSLCLAMNESHMDFTAKVTSIRRYLDSGKLHLSKLTRLDEVFAGVKDRLKEAVDQLGPIPTPEGHSSQRARHGFVSDMASDYTMHKERAVLQDFIEAEGIRNVDPESELSSKSLSSRAESNQSGILDSSDSKHDENIELF